MDWMRRNADQVSFNGDPTWGGMAPLFDRGGGKPFYPVQIWSDGSIGIYFQYMLDRPVFDDFEKRRELMGRLNQVPGFALKETSLSKCPQVKLDVFSRPEVTEAFLAVMDWSVTQLSAKKTVHIASAMDGKILTDVVKSSALLAV